MTSKVKANKPGEDEHGVVNRVAAAAMSPQRLRSEIVEMCRSLTTSTYELLVLVGEMDARGDWVVLGALSCASWLAEASDVDVSTARSQVRVAKAMRQFDLLEGAMRIGDVSYSKARVLTAYLTDENEAPLIELARMVPAAGLGVAIAAWSNANEDSDVIGARQHEARSVTWRTDPDGMVTFVARLTPSDAVGVCALIDRHAFSVRNTGGNTDGSDNENAPAGAARAPGRIPSIRQQRADAFVSVVTEGGGEVSAEILVHVRGDGNTLADGTPISDHAIASLLPDAFIALLIKDMRGRPIDASPRRRFPTRRQKRVVDERQVQCAHPGCSATVFLQYDHLNPFAKGGPTTTDNLQRLCGPHNRARWAALQEMKVPA